MFIIKEDNMEERLSIEQVLEITVNLLSGISIPASLVESVGVPISRGIGNLKACLTAIEREKQEKEIIVEEPEEEETAGDN